MLTADRFCVESSNFIEDALALPIAQQYRTLLQGLRFDYMDMKEATSGQYRHHYKSLAMQNQSPPATKMVRLA